MKTAKITKEVKEALDHVRSFYPNVCIVVFNNEGMWQYMEADFTVPSFEGTEIDIRILEAALDSVTELPAVFEIEHKEEEQKEQWETAYSIAQGCNAVDIHGVPEKETLDAMKIYGEQIMRECAEIAGEWNGHSDIKNYVLTALKIHGEHESI